MRGCILVMCGLPASGKTTLVSQIVSAAGRDQLTCVVVDYDRLMPEEVERKLIGRTTQDQDAKLWKQYREDIVNCTDRVLQSIRPPEKLEAEHFTEEKSTQSQMEAACSDATDSDLLWEKFSKLVDVSSVTNDRDVLLIIDDNMYYRSMRYDYYQIARKYQCGFCEVYLECSVPSALVRNKKRVMGKVSDDVIVAMETKMEKPNSSSYSWEKYSLVVPSGKMNSCSEVLSLVRAAMLDPVLPPVDNTEERLESRLVCSSNVVHQADQVLRKLLAQRLKIARDEGKTKEEMKALSALLSDVKAAILNDMRSGVVTFDTDAKDASKDENSELFRFVQDVFLRRTTDIR